MPTDEELQAAVQAAVEKANKEAEKATEKAVKEAANGKFTQEDLDRVAGEARKDGRTVGERETLKSLGISDVDAGKAALEAAKAAEDAQKTELQKAQEETAKLKEEAEAAKADARTSRVNTALALAIRDAGINPDRAAAAMRLVDPSKLEVKGDEVVGLDVAVKELKDSTPEWFGAKISPPDASGAGSRGPLDFSTASAADRDKELAKYGVKI